MLKFSRPHAGRADARGARASQARAFATTAASGCPTRRSSAICRPCGPSWSESAPRPARTSATPCRPAPHSFGVSPILGGRDRGLGVGEEPDPGDLRGAHVAQPGGRRVERDPARAAPQAHRGLHEHASGPQLAHLLERELELRPVLAHVVQPPPQALVAPIDRTRRGPPAAAPARRPGRAWRACASTSPRLSAATPARMVSTSFVDIVSRWPVGLVEAPVSRFRSRLERGSRGGAEARRAATMTSARPRPPEHAG